MPVPVFFNVLAIDGLARMDVWDRFIVNSLTEAVDPSYPKVFLHCKNVEACQQQVSDSLVPWAYSVIEDPANSAYCTDLVSPEIKLARETLAWIEGDAQQEHEAVARLTRKQLLDGGPPVGSAGEVAAAAAADTSSPLDQAIGKPELQRALLAVTSDATLPTVRSLTQVRRKLGVDTGAPPASRFCYFSRRHWAVFPQTHAECTDATGDCDDAAKREAMPAWQRQRDCPRVLGLCVDASVRPKAAAAQLLDLSASSSSLRAVKSSLLRGAGSRRAVPMLNGSPTGDALAVKASQWKMLALGDARRLVDAWAAGYYHNVMGGLKLNQKGRFYNTGCLDEYWDMLALRGSVSVSCPSDVISALCSQWAQSGECADKPSYMEQQCPSTCRKCAPSDEQFSRLWFGSVADYGATGAAAASLVTPSASAATATATVPPTAGTEATTTSLSTGTDRHSGNQIPAAMTRFASASLSSFLKPVLEVSVEHGACDTFVYWSQTNGLQPHSEIERAAAPFVAPSSGPSHPSDFATVSTGMLRSFRSSYFSFARKFSRFFQVHDACSWRVVDVLASAWAGQSSPPLPPPTRSARHALSRLEGVWVDSQGRDVTVVANPARSHGVTIQNGHDPMWAGAGTFCNDVLQVQFGSGLQARAARLGRRELTWENGVKWRRNGGFAADGAWRSVADQNRIVRVLSSSYDQVVFDGELRHGRYVSAAELSAARHSGDAAAYLREVKNLRAFNFAGNPRRLELAGSEVDSAAGRVAVVVPASASGGLILNSDGSQLIDLVSGKPAFERLSRARQCGCDPDDGGWGDDAGPPAPPSLLHQGNSCVELQFVSLAPGAPAALAADSVGDGQLVQHDGGFSCEVRQVELFDACGSRNVLREIADYAREDKVLRLNFRQAALQAFDVLPCLARSPVTRVVFEIVAPKSLPATALPAGGEATADVDTAVQRLKAAGVSWQW